MISPFKHELFQSNFNLNCKNFYNSRVVLNVLFSRNSILEHYLVLKSHTKDMFMIIGFDFVTEKIIPIETSKVQDVLYELTKFINSEYNTTGLEIKNVEKIAELYSKRKVKKEDFYSIENFILYVSSQRRVIPNQNMIYINEIIYKPSKSILIHNISGFLYGEIDFDYGNKNKFLNLHLIEDVLIKYQLDEKIYETAAKIYESKPINPRKFKLILSNFGHELSYMKLSYHSSKTSNPRSIIHELLRPSGIDKQQINIEGFEQGNAPFLIIIPVEHVKMEIEDFGIGDIMFLDKRESFRQVKGFKEFFKSELETEFFVFAHTIVESDNAYDAYLLAKEKVQHALDMLVHITKSEKVFNFYNVENKINNWKKLQVYQHPKCSTYYYSENIIGFEKGFSDTQKLTADSSLKIDLNLEGIFEELEWYEQLHRKKSNNSESKIERQLFNSIKWLNRSWQSQNIEDKIIYTNIAMEFLIDGIKVDPFIPKKAKSNFKGLLKTLLKENDDIFTDDISKKIKDKSLQGLTNPPLKVKIEALIKDLEIPITTKEFNKLWSIRQYRNDIIHGKSESETVNENVLFSNILVGELIAYRLKNIKGGVKD
jgi:hypothetical protein